MSKLIDIITEEISEMKRKGKDLHWRGRNEKGKMVTGKKAFARERDMNDETYKLRRDVMGHIYDAKRLLRNKFGYDLPRQRIRIIDVHPGAFIHNEGEYIPAYIAGCATRGGNDIYIPAKSIEAGWDLKYIVFHELLHSAFCLPHIKGSLLMNGERFENISNEETEKLFLQHVQESGKI